MMGMPALGSWVDMLALAVVMYVLNVDVDVAGSRNTLLERVSRYALAGILKLNPAAPQGPSRPSTNFCPQSLLQL